MGLDPLVSVIIPTYNRAGIICATIDNVLEQTYSNFELIVVDDGSTDGTLEKLARYGARIRVLSQANAGPAAARNRGVDASCGEIIAFQDSDDSWVATKLERQVALLERFGESVPCCLCNVLMRIADGTKYTSFDDALMRADHAEGLWLNAVEVLATRFVLFNQAVAIRRSVFEKLGRFDESLKYLEDYDLPLRLALEGPWAFIQDPLVIYAPPSRDSFSQMGLRDPITLKQCELEIIRRMLSLVGSGNENVRLEKLLKRRLRVFGRGLYINLRGSNSFSARFVTAVLSRLARYEEAIFRRSPGFPRMITVPADADSEVSVDTVARSRVNSNAG